jgi:hypothetical protein
LTWKAQAGYGLAIARLEHTNVGRSEQSDKNVLIDGEAYAAVGNEGRRRRTGATRMSGRMSMAAFVSDDTAPALVTARRRRAKTRRALAKRGHKACSIDRGV